MICISGTEQCHWDLDQTFVCELCKQVVCYCQGCLLGDGLDELCDVCWCAVTSSALAAGVAWALVLPHDRELARSIALEGP
jgi:hypothetical protein